MTQRRKTRLANQAALLTPAELNARHQAMLDKAIIRLRDGSRDPSRSLEDSDGGPLPKDETS
jgi:hypothetical protein